MGNGKRNLILQARTKEQLSRVPLSALFWKISQVGKFASEWWEQLTSSPCRFPTANFPNIGLLGFVLCGLLR